VPFGERRAEHGADHDRGYVGLTYRETTPKYGATAHADFPRYLLDTLFGSLRAGSRFNPPGEFGAVYVSLDPETPFRELRRAYTRLADVPNLVDVAARRILLTIDVTLARVVNLGDAGECRAWDVLPADLAGDDWTPCQAVARHVRREHEAIRYPSATGLGENLAIFYDRLRPTSALHLLQSEEVMLPER